MQFLTPSENPSYQSSTFLKRWIPEWIHQKERIEAWLADYSKKWTPPIYASVDIRHSKFKSAVIDTNLFSAGFNNLNEDARIKAIHAFTRALARRNLQNKRILLIPERHTRNTFYLESLNVIADLLKATGADLKIGFWEHESEIELNEEFKQLNWQPIAREKSMLKIGEWSPDLILLNNDLSSSVPEILQNLSTPLISPPLEAGWHNRRKSTHFTFYNNITRDFAHAFNIDAWHLNTDTDIVENVDFSDEHSLQNLQESITQLLEKINNRYIQHGILEKPYVVIKPDAGTYGMGIMMVHDASELTQLNRKQKNKMSVIKDGVHVNRVLLQEGISSLETYNNITAESVMYMVDDEVVGRFYRVHPSKDAESNLNAPGMLCEPVILDMNNPEIYLHSIVARFALIAASQEIAQYTQHAAASTIEQHLF
ncbi:MAG: glutamate--cysteine ligase [Pseudomonadota bacterium]